MRPPSGCPAEGSDDPVRYVADSFNDDPDPVAFLHRTDSLRGAREDQVLREKRHDRRNEGDDLLHGEDHVGGVRVLDQPVVQEGPYPEPVRIRRVPGRDGSADGTERVERLGPPTGGRVCLNREQGFISGNLLCLGFMLQPVSALES